ncbi:MAG: hypothetical protein QNK31_05460 [Porticoccus sp.]|nr:hypothetical protein [Porticoccus sp.]
MGNTKKSLAKTLPTLTLIFSLTIGSLIALILGLQVSSIATQQKNYLGKTLSSQLAKVVRDPIIRQDMLSLQVEVDEMLGIEGIQYAAVYDATNRPLAKAQKARYTVNPRHSHTSPITIENAVAGYVSVQLDQQFFSAPLRDLQFTFSLLWISLVVVLLILSIQLGKKLSGRLNHLIRQLPGDDSDKMDELSTLEHRIKPLLATRQYHQEPYDEQAKQHCALLAIACKNLTLLESRVNPEHFESVMSLFDALTNDAADLYGAIRLNADQSSIYLEFTGDSKHSDHPLRALYCATAIHALSKQLMDTQGIKLELASAISHGEQQLSASQLLNERHHKERLESLQSMLKQAINGQILLAKNTRNHPSMQEISLSPLTEENSLFRVDKLHETGDKLVTQQIALLVRNL